MSTVDGDETESSSVNPSNSTGNNDELNPRFGPSSDSEGGSKVVFLLKAAGGAPILKKEKMGLTSIENHGSYC